jgi:ABC-2 type transport system permease protein
MQTFRNEGIDMATASTTMISASTRPDRNLAVIYWKEAKYEFLKSLRLRAYTLSTLGFPVMFYTLFGLVMGRQSIGGVGVAKYLLATYGTFGVMGASLFGTTGALAAERGLGWLQVKRASPMPPFAYFAAKIIKSMIFSLVVVLLLFVLGVSFGGVSMPLADAAKLVGILVLGTLPFCAMGLALGYFIGPNSAPAVINLIYLPLSFCSGLWIPIVFLPRVLQQIAHLLPPYHLAQLGLSVLGAGQGESSWSHWRVLIAFTLICLGIARLGFQRDEGKAYG